jgi:hypothetical protein
MEKIKIEINPNSNPACSQSVFQKMLCSLERGQICGLRITKKTLDVSRIHVWSLRRLRVLLTSSIVEVSFIVQLLFLDFAYSSLDFNRDIGRLWWAKAAFVQYEATFWVIRDPVATSRWQTRLLQNLQSIEPDHHLLKYHRCTNKRSAGGRRRKDRPLSRTSTGDQVTLDLGHTLPSTPEPVFRHAPKDTISRCPAIKCT